MNIADLLKTTTFRWSLAIAAALLVQSGVLAGLFFLMTAHRATAEVDKSLRSDCRSIAGLSRDALVAKIDRRVLADVHRVELAGLFTADGRRISGNIASLPASPIVDRQPAVVNLVRLQPFDPVPNASRSIICQAADGSYAMFARDTDELDAISALTRRALLGGSLPAVVLAAALGLLLGWRGQQRFRRVEAAIQQVMAGRLDARLPARSSPDPFDRLSSAVNRMLDRLEAAINDLRCLGDDLAHELRTPLTRLRARLDRSCRDAANRDDFREAGERAIRDIDHALGIISAILRIRAIEQAERGAEFKRIDLATLMKDAIDLYAPSAEEKDISLTLDIVDECEVVADRDLLMEAVCNLLDNAIKFAPPGSPVCCSLRLDGYQPVLGVMDQGPGIAKGERQAVLRRFHRGTSVKADGHGIGLSLVDAIVRLHGFTFTLRDADPGCEAHITCEPAIAH